MPSAFTDIVDVMGALNSGPPDRRQRVRHHTNRALAAAIPKDQPKQGDGILNHPATLKGLALTGARRKPFGPAKLIDQAQPVSTQKRFASHPMLESQPIPLRNSYLSAYGPKPGLESGD